MLNLPTAACAGSGRMVSPSSSRSPRTARANDGSRSPTRWHPLHARRRVGFDVRESVGTHPRNAGYHAYWQLGCSTTPCRAMVSGTCDPQLLATTRIRCGGLRTLTRASGHGPRSSRRGIVATTTTSPDRCQSRACCSTQRVLGCPSVPPSELSWNG